jgi:NAD(P)-dependent dehydrogenase (short-subunit alcohol dehydrogenase family)
MDSTDQALSGKVAVVTGGASGIGAACAASLARAGASVVIADRDLDRAQGLARELDGAAAAHVDVLDPGSVDRLIAGVVERHGGMDLAVNSAGAGAAPGRVGDLATEDWRASIEGVLSSIFYCLRAEVRAMLERGGGAIVNVASVLGLVGRSGSASYVAAKHGVVGLTRAAALDYARDGIRVNAIAPGYVRTPLLEQRMDAAALTALTALHPVGRLGDPAEIGDVVALLLGPAGSFCTGVCLPLDGGYTAI